MALSGVEGILILNQYIIYNYSNLHKTIVNSVFFFGIIFVSYNICFVFVSQIEDITWFY